MSIGKDGAEKEEEEKEEGEEEEERSTITLICQPCIAHSYSIILLEIATRMDPYSVSYPHASDHKQVTPLLLPTTGGVVC